MSVREERLTVDRSEPFVVFLIGARINKWWMIPVIWAVARASGRMMKELESDPSAGLLSYESWVGRTTMTVMYWRSHDDLQRYAKSKRRAHLPAWARWVKRWALSGAVGIWHETYVVDPEDYECVYQHMPPFGLGKIGPLVPAEGELRTADQRIGRRRRRAA